VLLADSDASCPVHRRRQPEVAQCIRTRLAGDGSRVRATQKEVAMAEPVPAGSDASAGTYKCTNCGYQLDVGSTQHLPPCPSCGNGEWQTMSGGDSADDPYPGRSG
jgi:lipopolysaccharide biosynthesis regulator YciM